MGMMKITGAKIAVFWYAVSTTGYIINAKRWGLVLAMRQI